MGPFHLATCSLCSISIGGMLESSGAVVGGGSETWGCADAESMNGMWTIGNCLGCGGGALA